MVLQKREGLRLASVESLEGSKESKVNLEPIRELIPLIQRYKACTNIATPDYVRAKQELLSAVEGSADALSQLLEAVTNLEKLEKYHRGMWTDSGDSQYDAQYAALHEGFADELKRLLHPEDK